MDIKKRIIKLVFVDKIMSLFGKSISLMSVQQVNLGQVD